MSTTASHTSLSLTIGSAIYRNTMINYRFIFLLVWITMLVQNVSAQSEGVEILPYGERKEYEIGGINIQGAVNRDRNAIK